MHSKIEMLTQPETLVIAAHWNPCEYKGQAAIFSMCWVNIKQSRFSVPRNTGPSAERRGHCWLSLHPGGGLVLKCHTNYWSNALVD